MYRLYILKNHLEDDNFVQNIHLLSRYNLVEYEFFEDKKIDSKNENITTKTK